MKLEQVSPGYYVVVRDEDERREAYSLTEQQLKELLAPIRSRVVAEEIATKYRQATQRPQSGDSSKRVRVGA
jgi:heat shock protein HspQ